MNNCITNKRDMFSNHVHRPYGILKIEIQNTNLEFSHGKDNWQKQLRK